MKGILHRLPQRAGRPFQQHPFHPPLHLIMMVSLVTAFMVGTGAEGRTQRCGQTHLCILDAFTSSGKLFSLIQFIAFFGPLDRYRPGLRSINRERSARTLSKLASQPIYRDDIINGKFLAGIDHHRHHVAGNRSVDFRVRPAHHRDCARARRNMASDHISGDQYLLHRLSGWGSPFCSRWLSAAWPRRPWPPSPAGSSSPSS